MSRGRLHIDILAGTDELRKAIDEDGDIHYMLDKWRHDAEMFRETRSGFLLY
jgi:uncharacterized protein YbbC (DUF1343 family)